MSPYLFDHLTLKEVIEDLAAKLEKAGFNGKIQIVGGAAMTLSIYPTREATLDVDAKWKQSEIFNEVVEQITKERNFPSGWLNDDFAKFLPPVHDGDWVEVHRSGTVTIEAATPEFLLAMKLFADRGARDRGDTVVLIKILGITTPKEAEAILERYWPGEGLSKATHAFLQEFFAPDRE